MQTLTDKCSAIISLLEMAYAYRDAHPAALQVRRYGQAEDPSPPLRSYFLGCKGRCVSCWEHHKALGCRPDCPPEDVWLRQAADLRRRYRIFDIEQLLLALADHEISQAQAVWAVYVEPWPGEPVDMYDDAMGNKTEPISMEVRVARARLATDGVLWIAHDILGDVLGYGERLAPLDKAVHYWRGRGLSVRQIAHKVGCSKSAAQRVLAGA